ncbi:hypothetical protein AURDEDRAFT_130364 [Auricularia subglabra TFB-10046 SS5]|nr:hypothetical protein AURDEDRAFT_130364 [Auricularia subglabra TFB-10046 SS5]
MESDDENPYEKALPIARAIAAQNDRPPKMAERIYGACKGCDDSLEPIAPDFKVNPDYERLRVPVVPSATCLGSREDLYPYQSPRQSANANCQKNYLMVAQPANDERTRAQAATKPYAVDTETGTVMLDRYLSLPVARAGEATRIEDTTKRILRLIFQGKEEGRWIPWNSGAWAVPRADAAMHAWISNLRLTLLPHREDTIPDMMTHLLGNLDQLDPDFPGRVAGLLGPVKKSIYVKNASGTGKTRAFFEILTRVWGLYFSCFWDDHQDPHGSKDLHEALVLLAQGNRNSPKSHLCFTALEKASTLTEEQLEAHRNANKLIAEHIFVIVLLARVLILDAFLQEWNSFANKEKLSLEQKRRGGMLHWCRLQVNPHINGVGDVFHELTVSLLRVTPSDAQVFIGNTAQKWVDSYGDWFSLNVVVLDEAQEATSRWPQSFPSESRDGGTRPLLRPLVVSLTKWLGGTSFPLKLFIGATKLSENLVWDALVTALGKLKLQLTSFDALGDQSASVRIRATLTHFFGPLFVEQIPATLMTDIECWLSGRYRFLALFVQFCLIRGPDFDEMRNVLWNIVAQLTGHRLSDNIVDIPGMTLAPILSPKLLREPETGSTKEIAAHRALVGRLATNLLDIVSRLMIGRDFPTLAADDLDLVTLGVGRIKPVVTDKSSLIRVDEPLILTAIVGWVNNHLPMVPDINVAVKAQINSWFDTSVGSVRGHGNEDLIIHLLWRKFAGEGERLDKVFAFEYLRPAWAGRRARLLSVSSRLSSSNEASPTPATMVTPLVFHAKTEEETLLWFRNQRGLHYAFLKPDEGAGPDIILVLLLETGEELIILIQCKYWKGVIKKDARVVDEALFKLSPEGLYKGDSGDNEVHRANIRAELSRLMPTSLDMAGQNIPPARAEGPKYEPGPATIPLLRVFAAFKGSHELADTTKSHGAYPFAYLADDFIEFGATEFPAFKEAIEHARKMKSRAAHEERSAPAESTATRPAGPPPAANAPASAQGRGNAQATGTTPRGPAAQGGGRHGKPRSSNKEDQREEAPQQEARLGAACIREEGSMAGKGEAEDRAGEGAGDGASEQEE